MGFVNGANTFDGGNYMDREKGVKKNFSYDKLAYVWAAQSQREGRAGNGRMFFIDDTIYSYRSSWQLAKLVKSPSGQPCVLVNVQTYSVQTSKHLWCVQTAIRNRLEGFPVFTMDRDTLAAWYENSQRSHRDTIEYYESEFKSAREESCMPRIRQPRRDRALARCAHVANEANRFVEIFGGTVPFPRNPSEALALMLAYQPTQEG